MKRSNRICKWGAALAALVTTVGLGMAKGHAAVPQTLVYAVYDNENTAKETFNAMEQSQREGVIQIDSFAVVSKDQKGKVHVQSTQKRGALGGSIIGALLGLLGGPAGVAVGAGTGAALGLLTGETVGIPREMINGIKSSLTPGTSAVVAVVDERWAADLDRSLRKANAKMVLDHKIAGTAERAPDTGAAPTPTPTPSP